MPLPKYRIRKWTNLARECFLNNYACDKCTIVPEDLKPNCMVQEYAYETYKLLGKPLDDCYEDIEKIKDIKAEYDYTYEELANKIGISMPVLKNFVHGLGCSPRVIKIIKDFIERGRYGRNNNVKSTK